MSEFLESNNPAGMLPSVKLDVPVPPGRDSGHASGGDVNKLRSRFLDVHGDLRTLRAGLAAVPVDAAAAVEPVKLAAEAARDAALATARMYATTTAGIAAVAEGEYFSVPSGSTTESLILYRKTGGVAVESKRYPAAAAVDALKAVVDTSVERGGWAYALVDASNRVALGVKADGKAYLGNTDLAATVSDTATLKTYLGTDAAYERSGYSWALLDGAGRVALGVDTAGDLLVRGVNLNARLAAIEASSGQNAAYDKQLNGLSSVACWGDSLTAQGYTALLAAQLGRTVYQGGVGGQGSSDIATRQGGYVNLLTVTGNTIPASGAVDVTAQTQAPISDQGGNNLQGTLGGVPGTLTATYSGTTRTSLTFTRTTPGSAVAIDPATPFILDTFDHDFEVCVFWYGRNDFFAGQVDGYVAAKARVRDAVAASVAFLKPLNKKFVVLSVLNGEAADEYVGGAKHTAITALNEELKALYPRNFLDIRRALVRAYNPGVSQDVTDFGHDVVPSSLRTDTIHLNAAGRTLVSQAVSAFLQQKGW